MNKLRITGPGSGAEKYDLLTAMAVGGLTAGGTLQASMMRLIALVTARYNWAANEVSIGHKDLANLWAVDERTAKRETKRLIEGGFLSLKRPGVRGRVACYGLNTEHIYKVTEQHWKNVGTDFSARMACRLGPEAAPPEPPKVVRVDFSGKTRSAPEEGGPWPEVRQALEAQQPKLFAAWFAPLTLHQIALEAVTLAAPSRFAAQYITTHLLSHLDAAWSAALHRPMRCHIVDRG